jgi:peptidoglycan/LPS O-acetylase OafA/YrhL
MKRYELADYLKGYSIFTIIIFHYMQTISLSPFLAKAINIGGTGVHTFLLISGFGLYLSFQSKPLPFVQFIKRRLGKVYIPYILIVLLSAFITLFIPIYQSSWYALGGHVFLYKMFDSSIIGSYGGQFWFISTIIQFYLVFHGLAWLKTKTSNAAFLIIGLVVSIGWAVLIVYIGKSELASYNRFFLQYAWEFMLGMVIAAMVKDNSLQKITGRLTTLHYFVIGAIGMALYIVMALKLGFIGQLFNDIPALIGYGCVAIFLYRLGSKPINKFFVYTGDISYPLFIIHILINTLIIYFFGTYGMQPSAITLLLSLGLSYIGAHWYNKFVAQTYKWLGI